MFETHFKSEKKLCETMAKTDNVVPHSSWGTMSQELRQIWTNLACDLLLHPDVPEHKPVVIPLDTRFGLTNRSETKHPIIGIAVCTTTRKTTVQTLQEMSLFADLFPSLVATAEPNYEYWMYVLFDAGDPVLDNSAKIEEMATLFDTQVRQELIDKADIKSRLVLLRFNNEEAKPGPAFNFITQAAYEDGVDYIYRINDDTVFVDKNWPSALTGALASLSPPNVGVAGPFGINKPSILEHDFTHRIHHDIFPLHYPPILSDWWMDDWITRVYGRSRSKRVDNAKVNHNHRHGTRYDVDRSHGPQLDLEITRGRLVIEKWMHKVASNPESFSYNFTVTESDIEQYHRDVFKFSN